jgi:hypothetical protein
VKPAYLAASWSPTDWPGDRGSDSGGVWVGSNPSGRTGANQLRQQLPMRSMSAGRLARSPGVAGYGLVQSAEGLLDAGVDLVRTLGVALACSGWLGRWLGEPCAGLVGDRAGLVALGQWKQSLGSGCGESAMATILGRGQGGRPGRRRGPRGTSRRRPGLAVPSASCRVGSTLRVP